MSTRKYSLVIKEDEAGHSAYVPELPAILVTGESVEEIMARAGAAIRIYWEHVRPERPAASLLREIEVEVPV